jgi:hypothetical protein
MTLDLVVLGALGIVVMAPLMCLAVLIIVAVINSTSKR